MRGRASESLKGGKRGRDRSGERRGRYEHHSRAREGARRSISLTATGAGYLAVLAAMTGLAVPVATNSLVLNQLDIPPSGLIEMPA